MLIVFKSCGARLMLLSVSGFLLNSFVVLMSALQLGVFLCLRSNVWSKLPCPSLNVLGVVVLLVGVIPGKTHETCNPGFGW